MPTVLVVDDTAVDRFLAGAIIEERPGWTAKYAEDGRQALESLRNSTPDLVLTDLQMPEINGLELVEAIRREFSAVPVILMTAHGSEDIAVAALQKGAASYVSKQNLAKDLVPTVVSVLNLAKTHRNHQQALECLAEAEYHFVLANDSARVQPLVSHLQDQMLHMGLADKNGLIRIGTALREALINAIEHGNLELTSELRELEDDRAYVELVESRRQLPSYRNRCVRLSVHLSRREAVYVIRDEGRGFNPSALPDPTDPRNLEKLSGRGLFLIRTFMDEVRFNDTGNEITLIKRVS